jgi:uncharacterized RDD family membrane protein YckC
VADGAPSEVIGRRIGAALLDLLAILALTIAVGLAFGQGYARDGSVGISLHGAGGVVWAALAFCYFAVGEGLRGQTLGKRLLGIHVVSSTGGRPSVIAATIRTILRPVDFLPFLYLLGFLVVLATGRRAARLGDFAARTMVVAVPPTGRR